MPTTTSDRPRESPARRRVLDTASVLFYAEGVHAVGVDRIIAEAAVAKATFYHHFPAKDALVHAYLTEQFEAQRRTVADFLADSADLPAREVLVRLFDLIVEVGRKPDFRGCPFINAAAEFPEVAHPVRGAILDHRAWFRTTVADLLTAAGDARARTTADILMLLRDGLAVGCYLDDADAMRRIVRDALDRVLGTPGDPTR
ncbi:TetR family transcriptional regulator [Embleya scabrispora]|uniref:TetR family transcriptional regulator n=1 Tax=Embleya scabrispora TaxID=159449 RepID=A0A1T3NL44_9ACTN|nr:TetR/AcrR family transcriptional regulator [Embleya scabrispora]OPC77492.1 TetR family transcriptional regulator [Embleya scabrispora]